MQRFLGSLFVMAMYCSAAEHPTEELQIHQIFGLLNSEPVLPKEAVSALFTANADRADVLNLVTLLQQISASRRPWQELSSPHLSAGQIDFPTPVTGTVQVSFSPYGAAIPFSGTHFVMTLKKVGPGWKIALFNPDGAPRPAR